MLKVFKEYANLNKSLHNLLTVQFFVQLINISFIAILPLYMKTEGYSDAQYAHFTFYRYFGILTLALFLGMYIKGKKVVPMFYVAAIGIPFFALLILFAVQIHSNTLLIIAHLLWGMTYTFIQIPILPYILRNVPAEKQTFAISLNFATWSIASITGSLIIAIFNKIDPVLFNEHNLLLSISSLSFLSIYFVARISKKEHVPITAIKREPFREYDWGTILPALLPTTIFAIGAGFIVPFMGLFFANVHHVKTSTFSFMNFLTAVLVTLVAMYVPVIKSKFGFQKAIPTTQSFAIIALILMATTEYYNHLSFAVFIAGLFFLLRQPLMSMAVPMTLEITMKYVGEKNRELVSGLTSAIWSGAACISAIGFGIFRHLNISYVNIFFITAVLYSIAVALYKILLRNFDKKIKAGLIEK
jgi:MFS family permease